MTNPKCSEIWKVDFNPSVGSEIKKPRPAVIVSVNSIAKLPLRIVVPITDWKPHYEHSPWFVNLQVNNMNGLSKNSGADAFQVKSVSLVRFVEKLGNISKNELNDIKNAIAICIGI